MKRHQDLKFTLSEKEPEMSAGVMTANFNWNILCSEHKEWAD